MLARFLALLCAGATVSALKPVFLFHGVTGSPASLVNVTTWLREADPARTLVNLDLFNGVSSWAPLLVQVPAIAAAIRAEVARNETLYADGYHLVCHSQGGITCRGVVQEMDDHRIDTFISLAGPQGGQFGSIGETLPAHYGNISTPLLYLAFYTPYGQHAISVANFWRDNLHIDMFYEHSEFLPRINNIVNATQRFKDNWLRVRRVALCGGPDDGTIVPWISTQFGTYNMRNEEPFIPMQQQDYYVADTFGLKSMDARGDLLSFAPAGVTHEDWVHDPNVFQKFILPLLQT
jgi:palmitoyl-protein thioesterase